MMLSNANFVFTANPARVVFARGGLSRLADEVRALSASRALVLCTPQQRAQAELAASLLGDLCVGIHDGAEMHVPIASARWARQLANELGADCAVAIGGGSTIGLGKAIALESSLPIIAVPTTYAGSEMTPIYGITDDGIKKTGRDLRVLPRTVIYDPNLSDTLPLGLSIVSGINAMAHAAEGLYANDGNPVMALMAEEGIRALAEGLSGLNAGADPHEARDACLYGAWQCGTVLGHLGMALHHKLCHTLGGSFNLPHAETHTVVLPHALAYNAEAAPEAMRRIAHALKAPAAAGGVYDLARRLGAPTSLQALGMLESDLARATDIAMSNPYWNPRPIERAGVQQLLRNAWEGRRPD